jgi:hypothetical protein
MPFPYPLRITATAINVPAFRGIILCPIVVTSRSPTSGK